MNLRVVEIGDIAAQLPAPVEFAESLSLMPDVDLLLVASGFEPRLTAVAASLREAGVPVHAACYITYQTNEEDNAAARSKLLAELVALGTSPTSIDGDGDSREFAEALQAVVSDAGARSVVLDISAASSRLILRTVHTLVNLDVELTIAYAQAETYYPLASEVQERRALSARKEESLNPGTPEDETLGLDFDVRDVDFSIEYPGLQLDQLPHRVVMFAGYNAGRARAVLADVDAALLDDHPSDRVTWIVGDPLLDRDKWRFDALVDVNGLRAQDGSVHPEVVALSTFDYLDVLRELERQHEMAFGAEHLTVAPMGAKMQTLAVALFCEMHPDVRVLIALPKEYSHGKYSEGVEKIWAVALGDTQKLRDLFRTLGCASIEA